MTLALLTRGFLADVAPGDNPAPLAPVPGTASAPDHIPAAPSGTAQPLDATPSAPRPRAWLPDVAPGAPTAGASVRLPAPPVLGRAVVQPSADSPPAPPIGRAEET